MKNFSFLLTMVFGLLCLNLSAQTTYTWSGATSTNWADSTNWSPSGVPSAGSGVIIANVSNKPVLDNNRGISSLTMNSGSILNLDGFTLTVTGASVFNSATINSGQLITGSFIASLSAFTCQVMASGVTITTNLCTYASSVSFTYTAVANADNLLSQGNTFFAPTRIIQNGSKFVIFGITHPDVFKDSLIAISNGTNELRFGFSSIGNRFEGYTFFQRGASATKGGVFLGSTNFSTITFTGKVELSSLNGIGSVHTPAVSFNKCVFDTSSTLGIHSSGFNVGQLSFIASQAKSALSLSLAGNSSLLLSGGSVFDENITLSASNIFINSCTFNGQTLIEKTGSGTDQCFGPITANASTHFKNSGIGWFIIEGDYSDVYDDVVLENTSTGSLSFCRRGSGNVVNGNLQAIITNGSLATGYESANRLSVTGNISINSTGGKLYLHGLTQQSGASINYTNLFGGLSFGNFIQLGNARTNLVSTGSANRINLNPGSSFAGVFNAQFPSILISGGTFADSLILTKTGSIVDQGAGGLVCYGPAVFNGNHSDKLWEINYAGPVSVFHQDVHVNRFGAGQVDFGYSGAHHFKKNLYFNGTGQIGVSAVTKHMTFNGQGDQYIRSSNGYRTPFAKLTVNKPSGDLHIEANLNVYANLNLQKGKIVVSNSNGLLMVNNCTITGGSDSSYVGGPMSRVGTTVFTYPLGGGGVYAPLTLSFPLASGTYKAEYIAQDPDSLYSRASKDTTIGFVNRCGYWKVDRTAGTHNTTSSLGWSNNPCYSTSPIDASIALWDGSTWKNKGNAAYSGTSTAGVVKSTAALTSYPAIVNLGGVCNLVATLSANRDTLIQGYLATFTASPANQSNYQFYVNNVLKQDSSASKFKSSTLLNGDIVKVIIKNIDNCTGVATSNAHVLQISDINHNINWLNEFSLFAHDTLVVITNDSIYCNESLITSNITGNTGVINGITIQTSSVVEQTYNSGMNLKDNLNNLVGAPLSINDSNIVLSPGIYFLETASILKNKLILNGTSNSLFIFNINNDATLDSLILIESTYIGDKNRIIFNINGNATIANIALNYYSLLAKNIVVKKNYNLNGSIWAKNNIRIDDPIIFYGQGFPSEPDNCYYPGYPCNRIKNSEFSCPLPTTTWGLGWQPNGSFSLNSVTNQIYWNNANANPGSYLQRQNIGGTMEYFLGLNPATNGSAVQQLTGFNIQQGELYYIKFRYKNSGNSCNTTAGYCPLDRLFVSVSEGVSFAPFSTLNVPADASFTNNPTYNNLPESSVAGIPPREYFTASQLGNITNLDWVEYVSGPHTAAFDINSISFYARMSQWSIENGNAALWGGNVFIDNVRLESCCLGDLATLVSSKTSDFINGSTTTNPTVKDELASIISISSINPGGFTGSLENIHLTINGNNSGTISVVGSLTVDVGRLEILNSELIFSKCSSISFSNPTSNLRQLIINSSFLHACDSKLWSGIHINGSNSEAIYINHSRIEDALAAVQAINNPLLLIDDNVFNRNVKHIQMRNCKDQSNSEISNNKFLCNDPANPVLGASPSFALSETDCEDQYFLPYITNFDIDLQLVNNLTIERNNFENAYCGIRCLASSINVLDNNTFNLIRDYVNPVDIEPSSNLPVFNAPVEYAGSGIFQNNSFLASKIKTAGGYLHIKHATFTNLRLGVRILNSNLSKISKNSTSRTDIQIQNCGFDNAAYSLNGDILNTAISINGVRAAGFGSQNQTFAQNILIEQNYIDGFSFGIDVKDSQSDLDIRFNNISTITQTNNWKLRTAISLKEFYPYNYTFITYPWFPSFPLIEITAYEPYFINDNIIGNSSLRDIVVGRGIQSDFSSYGNIVANTINMYAINTSQSAFGVVSINSSSVYIVDNLIRRNNASVPSNQQYANNGILIENSKNNIVCENETYNFASGLRIVNSSNNLQVKCNLFKDFQYQGVSLKNALFGDQVFETGAPFDNRWIGTSGKRIKGSLNTQTPYDHKWYYGSSTAYPGQLELNANAPSGTNVYVAPFDQTPYYFQTVNNPSSTSLNCGNTTKCTEHAIPTFFGAKRLGQRDSLFGEIINDFNPELFSDTSSADEYSIIKYAFETFYMDPSWLNIGDPSDTLYQNYFLACLDLPLAKQIIQNSNSLLNTPDSLMIDSLETLYNDNDTLISEALNQWTSNNINQIISENNRMSLIHNADSVTKQALNIYYNTWKKGKYSLTTSDSAALNAIAFIDPSIAGEGVYLARMLLDTIVVEVEPQARIGQVEILDNSINASLNPLVFPNPTNGTITVDLNFEPEEEVQVSLMDLTGRIIFKATQDSQIKSYSFDYLASGLYLYRIEFNKNILSQDRLVIQRP